MTGLRRQYKFRHKDDQKSDSVVILDRRKSAMGLPSMGWKLLVGFVVVLVLGAGALAYYGATAGPERRSIEQVLPDNTFPK